ncbi:Toxin co-regulated pilus biosynthesis protein P [Vibrio harveyi]|uniref:winged helix-turn-helix domain-containing protein n=1 Tax=Vibrio harveyi TaxID=669 RepID=UPI001EFE1E14|nr:winged helix-turn-helix domain-containing protein [Vibrio harveyi]MCG9233660.1 winged helix-turn-helix domain-containing protein [Vibrio harveyi]MCG9586504.1 winged helix-turn-helix domain-containing protein [Vibrio harveyi]CAH1201504.1 Toxin co-regulated pilus biosynthesis protein P [Vibrio harveyi]CAH1547621.1 Toxin co-regulated pilus biosynthesis protein P [Vibrio harveyi]CAH1549140.1 Toxin co-regulated pilus biosynthesis protein P [Vibrio harveyi]
MKNNNRIVLGKFTWDRTTHYLLPSLLSGKTEELDALKLTNKQKALLNCLVDAYPNTISNKEIIQQVWGYEHISQESLPQLINRTRRTLEDNEKTILVNTPGVGYSLNFTFAPEEPITKPEECALKSTSKQNAKLWNALFIVMLLVTLFNLYETTKALYYKHDFEQVLRAKAYPEMNRSKDGTITLTIDNHECIYHKDELLLKCP